jgi:hypothetical protein
MMLMVLVGLLFGGARPLHPSTHRGVLAYATDMSAGGLLSSTNTKRSENGVGSLKANSQLNSAAQAKANDMVARNYWSHNTPDGQTPWTFVQSAGYKYTKVGENLAYGFATSSDAVVGWMNSATHKANMLDGAFTEVGFGIANGSNYNASGEQTVVVAMYGQPQVLAQSSSGSSSGQTRAATKESTPASAPAAPVEQPQQPDTKGPGKNDTVVSTRPIIEPASTAVVRANIWTSGKTPWIVGAVTALTGLSLIILLVRHGLRFRHFVKQGEQLVLRHPLVDMILVAIIMLGYVLSATKGVIK